MSEWQVLGIIGRKIAKRRDWHGMSISELARRSGVSRQTVYGIEIGQSNPTVATLVKLATALHCTINDFMPAIDDYHDAEIEKTEHAIARHSGLFRDLS